MSSGEQFWWIRAQEYRDHRESDWNGNLEYCIEVPTRECWRCGLRPVSNRVFERLAPPIPTELAGAAFEVVRDWLAKEKVHAQPGDQFGPLWDVEAVPVGPFAWPSGAVAGVFSVGARKSLEGLCAGTEWCMVTLVGTNSRWYQPSSLPTTRDLSWKPEPCLSCNRRQISKELEIKNSKLASRKIMPRDLVLPSAMFRCHLYSGLILTQSAYEAIGVSVHSDVTRATPLSVGPAYSECLASV